MRVACWFFIAAAIVSSNAVAADYHYCTGNGPCGPRGLEWAVPQGFAGADFRPACARHDACYSASGVTRGQCDRQFRRDLHRACGHSRCPILCHVTAETMSVVTRLFGGPAYRGSQRGWYR